MGAEPHSALATAVTPFATKEKTEEDLYQLLAGANEMLRDAGASLIGGHSSEGERLALGFTVNGWTDPESVIRRCGAGPGDQLILTKAIGTGTIFAAEMQRGAQGRWVAGAVEMMLVSNRTASEILRRYGVTAMTDVTGFGLAGHLLEMLRAAAAGAAVESARIPVLAGASETAAAGHLSSLQPQNERKASEVDGVTFPLLFDPQTSGGLLAAVPEAAAETALGELHGAGYVDATIIGEIREGAPRIGLF